MDAGYRGRAAPCQRERSDRALDRVTAVETFHRGDVPDSHRPPFGLLAEAVPQQPRAGNRPVSEARPALRTDNRETSGHGVETECGRPPPNRHNRFPGKSLNRPLGFYVRPSRPSCAFRGPHTAMCHGAPGHERVSRDLYFWTGRTNPPSAQIRGRGPELPLNRHE